MTQSSWFDTFNGYFCHFCVEWPKEFAGVMAKSVCQCKSLKRTKFCVIQLFQGKLYVLLLRSFIALFHMLFNVYSP